MENLKKELQEKGYTFFKMQDYPQFEEEYQYFKKYICNSETNLLNNISSVRIDGKYSNNAIEKLAGKDIHANDYADSFEEIQKKVDTEYLPYVDFENFFQYWYYGEQNGITNDFKKLINKIVENVYGENPDELQHLISLTYYKPGCFLNAHADGKVGTRICAVLVYLNDEDYQLDWGGNIVFERTETIPPIYGNVAILDFKEGNCIHEVKKVVDGYGRFAILSFVSLGQPTNTPDYY